MEAMKRKAVAWLRQGISPQRLALTLSLGFAIGCIPVVGIPTLICAALALALRLNLPAIQAANYLVMPLQVALILPFVRLGGRLFSFAPRPALDGHTLLHTTPMAAFSLRGGLASQARLGGLVGAIPAVARLTLLLTAVLRRVPAVSATEAGN